MKLKVIMTILCVVLLASIVGAVSVTNVKSPKGILTSSRTTDFTFSLDEEPVGCWFQIGLTNGTTLGNYTNGTISTTKSGKSYTNASYAVPIDSAVGNSHNFSIYCGATAATATLVDTKTFNIKVGTPTSVSPIEGTVYDTKLISPSMTVPVGINKSGGYKCQYNFSNGTITGWTDLNTTNNLTWYNISGFTTGIDSAVGTSHLMRYRCNDTSGYNTAELISFKVDTTSPTIVQGNITRSGSVGIYIMAVTDTTTITCSANIYDNTGASAGTVSGTATGTGASKNCTYSITSTSLGGIEGDYNLEPIVTDSASNVGTLANKSGVLRVLYTGWNIISWADVQANLSTICSEISGCTSTSWYNNTAKTFTTYTTIAPSVNAGKNVPIADNAHIKVSADTYLLMDNKYSSRSADNESIFVGWNLLSLYNSATLNTTLASHDNITWASEYVGSVETYYTCNKALNKCAGTTSTPDLILMPKGTSAWVLTNENASINRSGVSG